MTQRDAANPTLGGKVIAIVGGPRIETFIEGPADPLASDVERLTIPLIIRPQAPAALELELPGDRVRIEIGSWSRWVRMRFRVTPFSTITGIARFRVVSVDPEVELYMSPINHDPSNPAVAITEPKAYAAALRARLGDYKTVGWNHETWGLNEERIDDDAFMEDLLASMAETEALTLGELDAGDAELFVSVFTETDRVAHMMYRLLDDRHPRYDAVAAAKHGDAILRTYRRMDQIVSRVIERLGPRDVLLIVSDHGFHSWRRGLNVNSWLVEEGYMTLENGARSTHRPFLMDVDWSRTRAYSLGVGAIYLNVRGREGEGIVEPGEDYRHLAAEMAEKLRSLVDPQTGERVVERVYFAPDTWKGQRIAEAQDLQLGMAPGYRVSAATPLGGAPEGLFEDNRKKWSGDHAASPSEATEGVLLSNRRIEQPEPSILDVAPTILRLLEVEVPAHYDGHVLPVAPGASS